MGKYMANSVTISQVEDRLRRLPPEKLAAVYDFMALLLDRNGAQLPGTGDTDSLQTMAASENVLRRDWDRPEEDAAWADL